jgi:hypothetical protein
MILKYVEGILVRKEDVRNSNKFLVKKPEGKRPLQRPGSNCVEIC